MRVATSLLTVLVTLAGSVAGNTGGGIPALMTRHARAARRLEAAPPGSGLGSHINTHVRRACKSKPKTSGASSVSLPAAHTSVDPVLNASMTTPTLVVNVVSAGSCGPSGAITQTTALSGPNGDIDFLNCGLTSAGWTPPLMYADGVVSVELSQVAYNPGSAFSACKDFVPIFEKYGRQYNIPAVMLASFAMQESSCIPTTVGGAGEQGLMQITVDKCDGAPENNCQDPDFNIHQGAQFFSQTLDSMNGDLLLAIGGYNGWYKGLTYAEATAAAQSGNCLEQNNLDYLHQFLNGWMQDVNAYENDPPLGKYFNLNACADRDR